MLLVINFFVLIFNMLKKCLKILGYLVLIYIINNQQVKVKAFSYFVGLGSLVSKLPFLFDSIFTWILKFG